MLNSSKLKYLCNVAVAFGFAITLSGCASQGDQLGDFMGDPLGSLRGGAASKYEPAFVKANLIKGKTTIAEVRQKFGAPYEARRTQEGNGETEEWAYKKSEEGVNAMLKMYRKYAPTQNTLDSYNQEAKVGKTFDVMDDVGTVTGTKTTEKQSSYDFLQIKFVNGVVYSYSLS